MSQAKTMYAVPMPEIKDMIMAGGALRTVLIEGDMGNGKSSLLWEIAAEMPTHTPCYVDCTTKDLGDLTIPNVMMIDDETGYVRYVPNEELGLHLKKPIIMMIDEFGKNRGIQNAMLRLMLERVMGSHKLHKDSIVFATTNLGAEGVGDLIPPHSRNRITSVQAKKYNWEQTIEYGINKNWHTSMLGFIKDNPQVCESFVNVKDPSDNEYIYHPQAPRAAFCTGRSLHAASDWLHVKDKLSHTALMAALIGTIGDRAAMDLMAFVTLVDDLPSRESIKTDPHNAIVPSSAAATCMVVYRTLASMDRDFLSPWMTYLPRLTKEAQGMFAQGVSKANYAHTKIVMNNKKYQEWAVAHNYMFGADI